MIIFLVKFSLLGKQESTKRGISENAPIWKYYVQEANFYDKENITNWSQTMDVLLVFVSLVI